jgi:Ser/Thr protein kinase RdoA (MazF antagonist)
VHRVGDTVRRTPPERADFVHALLDHLDERGWAGAPRYLGTDDLGREVLSYVEGHVPLTPPERAALATPDTVLAVGEPLRELHDLTAGSALAGDREVVCHNDLSPKNTVYRDGRPVAFLDWDLAAPGDRIADVAHCCWQFPELGPQLSDPAAAGRLVRAVADGYRLADRGPLVDRILRWQQDCWLGITAGIAAGDPRFGRLRDADAVRHVRAEQRWTQAHRAALYSALTG